MARNLFLHDRIVTTPTKAKAVRRFVERLVTRARRAVEAQKAGDKALWLHHLRVLAVDVPDKKALRRLLDEVAPRSNRPGGYTRIVHEARRRVGDSAPLAVFEFVDRPEKAPEEEAPPAAEKGAKAPKARRAPKGGKKEQAAASSEE